MAGQGRLVKLRQPDSPNGATTAMARYRPLLCHETRRRWTPTKFTVPPWAVAICCRRDASERIGDCESYGVHDKRTSRRLHVLQRAVTVDDAVREQEDRVGVKPPAR